MTHFGQSLTPNRNNVGYIRAAEPESRTGEVTMVRLYSWYPLDASAIKALVLDRTGQPINRRARIETPSPCTPAAVMEAIRRLAKRQDKFDRVAVGFPGVVRSGIIETGG